MIHDVTYQLYDDDSSELYFSEEYEMHIDRFLFNYDEDDDNNIDKYFAEHKPDDDDFDE